MIVTNLNLNLSPLARALENDAKLDKTKERYLIIKPSAEHSDQFEFELRFLSSRVTSWFYSYFSEEEMQSVRSLKEMLGEGRVKRIFNCRELPALYSQKEALESNRVLLTAAILKELFLGLAQVKKEDIEEIASSDLGCMTLVQQLAVFRKAIPFEELNDVFMGEPVSVPVIDKAPYGSFGIEVLKERVATIFQAVEFYSNSNLSLAQKKVWDMEVLSSRLADREPPKNVVIPLHEGLYYYDGIISGRGAYISVLKGFYTPSFPKIVCRGTACRNNATSGWLSGLNDLQYEMGVLGVTCVWSSLQSYLEKNHLRAVSVYGKSLGGAQAQYIATLIRSTTPVEVLDLTTYASVGIPLLVEKKLWEDYTQPQIPPRRPMHITVYRNMGMVEEENDFVPYVGGVHFGYSADKLSVHDIRIFHLFPEKPAKTVTSSTKQLNFKKLILDSLSGAHARQNTLMKDYYIEERCYKPLLGIGTTFERSRQIVATLFHVTTLGLLNYSQFLPFYERERNRYLASMDPNKAENS